MTNIDVIKYEDAGVRMVRMTEADFHQLTVEIATRRPLRGWSWRETWLQMKLKWDETRALVKKLRE